MNKPIRTPAFALYKGYDERGKVIYEEPIPADRRQQRDERTWTVWLDWAPPRNFTFEALTLLTEKRNIMCTEWMGDTTLQRAGRALDYPCVLAADQPIQLTLSVNLDERLP